MRTLAALALRSYGYTVLEAKDGSEAAALCAERGPIDLLLTDVVMPNVSGRELATTLLAQSPRMRVLFMSGYTDDAVIRHGVLGLAKFEAVRPRSRKVREVLDGRRRFPETIG